MIDILIRSFLIVGCLTLAVSLWMHPRSGAQVIVSENGIVPPDLIQSIEAEDVIFERSVGEMNFDKMPLDRAIQLTQKNSGVEINVRWKVLEGAGIDNDIPVNCHLRRHTLFEVLTQIADSAGGGTTALNFAVHGNAIEFSTVEDLEKASTVEIYNIRPLIAKIRGNTHDTPKPAITDREAVNRIRSLLADLVVRDEWIDENRRPAMLEAHGLLTVIRPPADQRKIATFLTRMDAGLN